MDKNRGLADLIKVKQTEAQDLGEALDQMIYEAKRKENDNQQLK